MLNNESVSIAITFLIKTWKTMQDVRGIVQEELIDNNEKEQEVVNSDTEVDPFLSYMKSLSQSSNTSSTSLNCSLNSTYSTDNSIKESLEKFRDQPILHYNEDITSYWEQQKSKANFVELYELAQVLLAVPATQVIIVITF